jgi:thiamine-phosphate diphosphorylase
VTLVRTRGLTCIVTDRHRLLPAGTHEARVRAVVAQARAAAEAGVDFLQIRERDLSSRELSDLVADIVKAVEGAALRVLVNDRVDVAIAMGAHGVQLPASGIAPEEVRRLAPRPFVVGQSIHGRELPAPGADFGIFGTVFPTLSKGADHQVAGVTALAAAARGSSAPVLAIGGITSETVRDVAPCCAGVAAIGWFSTTDRRQMSDLVREVRRVFDTIPPLI